MLGEREVEVFQITSKGMDSRAGEHLSK